MATTGDAPEPCPIGRSTPVNDGSLRPRQTADLAFHDYRSHLGVPAADHLRPYKADFTGTDVPPCPISWQVGAHLRGRLWAV